LWFGRRRREGVSQEIEEEKGFLLRFQNRPFGVVFDMARVSLQSGI